MLTEFKFNQIIWNPRQRETTVKGKIWIGEYVDVLNDEGRTVNEFHRHRGVSFELVFVGKLTAAQIEAGCRKWLDRQDLVYPTIPPQSLTVGDTFARVPKTALVGDFQ